MGKHEQIDVSAPLPIAKSVLVHRKRLEAERDGLRAGAAVLALKSSQGDSAAQAELAAIPGRLAALTFEIDMNHEAHQLAIQQDSAAEAGWRAGLQSMAPEDVIAGIGKDSCCGLCRPGSFCVITAGYPYAGAQCGHPIREQHVVFGRDATGTRQFLYAVSAQALKVFTAARQKLNVPDR